MKKGKRIYCIEGHWNYGKREAEPSVEPMLQLLSGMGEWTYARRDVATREEMEYWLQQEWPRCSPGSILYIASHGGSGQISIAPSCHIELSDVACMAGNCKERMVHFGGCNVLSGREDSVRRKFMQPTGAAVVSGYRRIVGWSDSKWRPAVALELLLFSSVWQYSLSDGRSVRGLESVRSKLRKRFDDCEFELYI